MAALKFSTPEEVKNLSYMLFVGTAAASVIPIAYSTSASLNFSKDTIDTSNKMDAGWSSDLGGKKKAEISADAFCAPSNSTGMHQTALYEAFVADTPLYFKYCAVTVTEDEDGMGTTVAEDLTKPYYTGRLKIASLNLTSDNGDVAKYSASANSQGAVTQHGGSAA